jgi:ATP-dependent protease HslVU (ClpYQ) peptidase subunit
LKTEYFIETKEKDDQPVESSQWDCLILSPAGIYSVQSYREAVEFDKYWADGSGLRLALGAMHAVYDIHKDPKQIAEAAIRAASEFDDATALPAQIFELKMRGK